MTIHSPPHQGLRVQRLSRQVGPQLLLDNLDLDVAPGEILALLGPSGCGKSTTLRLIAGLDPVSHGEIQLGGRTITQLAPAQRQVAMVFQSYALFPHLSVERNLSLGMELRGVPSQRLQEELDQVLALLQLEPLRWRRPAELSGGQRQRVALARALLRRPALFLLDEPMSNLDAQLREELRAELRQLLRSTGAPVLYVTHDQQEAMGLADRIAVLRDGRLQQIGTAEQLYNNPTNRFVARFLGTPSINLLDEGAIQLGLRPEHLQLRPADQKLPEGWRGIAATIAHQEWLGDRVIVHLHSGRHGQLKLQQPQPAGSGPWQLCWPRSAELHFDAIDGTRLP
ncbi:MAG: hypothetical protein RLZZ631_1030 [Cyanobacteriota bacterium]